MTPTDVHRAEDRTREAPPQEPLGVPVPDAPPRRIGRRGRVAAVVLLTLLGLWLARVPILVGVARAVSVEDPLRPADLIFVLGGEPETRPFLAAELYRRGLAPRVVLPWVQESPAARLGIFPSETDASVRILTRLGVPDSAVVVLRTPGGVTSTTDEAAALAEYLRREPASRVVLVTTKYHTRRARWLFRRELEELDVELVMAGVESPEYTTRNWWRSERGVIDYFNEYLKFLHNWLYR